MLDYIRNVHTLDLSATGDGWVSIITEMWTWAPNFFLLSMFKGMFPANQYGNKESEKWAVKTSSFQCFVREIRDNLLTAAQTCCPFTWERKAVWWTPTAPSLPWSKFQILKIPSNDHEEFQNRTAAAPPKAHQWILGSWTCGCMRLHTLCMSPSMNASIHSSFSSWHMGREQKHAWVQMLGARGMSIRWHVVTRVHFLEALGSSNS